MGTNKSKSKKKNFFEMLCTMDEGTPKQSVNRKKNTNQDKSAARAHVSNRSANPYGNDGRDDDFPPFDTDDTPRTQSQAQPSLFDDAPTEEAYDTEKRTAEPRTTRRVPYDSGATGSTGARSGAKRSSQTAGTARRSSSAPSGKVKKGETGTAANRKPASATGKSTPAEIAYRAEPYLVLIFGGLLLLSYILSLFMSGGRFDLTPDTHPFRLIGYWVEYFFFGVLGYGAFLLPFGLIYLAVCHIRAGKDWRIGGRGWILFAILVLFPAMVHTGMIRAGVEGGALETWRVADLYTFGAAKTGGGVLGGLLGRLGYIGLGTLGTMLIGALAMAIFLMLFFGTTPASLWRSLRAWYADRAERTREYREREEERRAGEQARIPAPASGRMENLIADQAEDGKQQRRREREEKRREADAFREANTSELKEAKRETASEKKDADGAYLDPTRALLAQKGKIIRRERQPEKGPDDPWFAPVEEPTPLETVKELTPEEVLAQETEYEEKHRPTATTVPVTDEPEDPEEAEPIVEYPKRAEIDLYEEGELYDPVAEEAEEELPPVFEKHEEIPENAENVETTVGRMEDCREGYDYELKSDDEAIEDEKEEENDLLNGVELHVDKLDKSERERGNTIVTDEQVRAAQEEKKREYVFPKIEFLNEAPPRTAATEDALRQKADLLRDTLANFKVRTEDISYVRGPTVTRYEIKPAPGVRVRSISVLVDDIALSLAASGIRMEAPIPGKTAIGIEIPNDNPDTVSLRGLIDSEEFRGRKSKLTACLGEDVGGNSIMFDIVKMPHLLIAGTTGSGKSVCINSIIMSLLYKAKPEEVKLILIDPKTVEFSVYRDIPHLMAPIVCEAKRAAAALNLAVLEMNRRFEEIRSVGVRDIAGYNAATANDRYEHPYMPQIVIIIDELADLMMQAKDEVEASICRLAQKARAAGMHLIIGTQRPSVDVVTGLIKANVPSRIAFAVKQQVDSRVMLDISGAEKLIGHGDMLYAPIGCPKPLRVQGAFVSDGEVEKIVDFIRRNNEPVKYDQDFLASLDREAEMIGNKQRSQQDDEDTGSEDPDGLDPKFYEALKIAMDSNRISTSLLQRTLSVGYSRAAKIIDQMEAKGFVSQAVGNKPREIRITREAYEELLLQRDD